MKQNTSITYLALAMLWLSAIAVPVSASTIFWGSKQNDTLVDSAGNSLDASYQFELGYFNTSSGWAPTSLNISEWESKWIVFDKASFGVGWDPTNREINTSVDHTSTSESTSASANPASIFTQGATVYLWVYNSKTLVGDVEWALLCDSDKGANVFGNSVIPSEQYVAWQFPDPNLPSTASFDWQTRDLDTAILGGVNGVQGPGGFSLDPGVFTIQTHVVPEPGSAVLIIVAGIGLAGRRRTGIKIAN